MVVLRVILATMMASKSHMHLAELPQDFLLAKLCRWAMVVLRGEKQVRRR
jgi:hypothetical protein